MNTWPDQPVINGLDTLHLPIAERRHICGDDIGCDLVRTAGTGYDTADGVKHEDPAQGILGQRKIPGKQGLQLFDRLKPGFIINA